MISLIPYIREAFRRHLTQKQSIMLTEFDKLKRVCSPSHSILMGRLGWTYEIHLCFQDYQEHQNEIHAKLIAIMGDRLNTHIRTLQVRVLCVGYAVVMYFVDRAPFLVLPFFFRI